MTAGVPGASRHALTFAFACGLTLGHGGCSPPRNAIRGADGSTDAGADAGATDPNAPFGLHEAVLGMPGEGALLEDLGVGSVRPAPIACLVWDIIERERGQYDWSAADAAMRAAQDANLDVICTVGPQAGVDGTAIDAGAGPPSITMPTHLDWYLEFLERAAERYDGDGVDDAPGGPRVQALQIGNEVDGETWADTPESYALLLKESYSVIKRAAPAIQVAIAGAAGPDGLDRFYTRVFRELARLQRGGSDPFFDVFDVHWSAQFPGDDDYAVIQLNDGAHEMREFMSQVNQELATLGHRAVPFYVTEMTDYSGIPEGYSYHSEEYQASSLVKRFVYALAAGVERIYWTQTVEWHAFGGIENGYFDNTGLINNPENDGASDKKLAYYSYKLLINELAGSDWSRIDTVIPGTDGVFGYRFVHGQTAESTWVLWCDGCTEAAAGLAVLPVGSLGRVTVTEAVPDAADGSQVTAGAFPGFFRSWSVDPAAGSAEVSLGARPVFVSAEAR